MPDEGGRSGSSVVVLVAIVGLLSTLGATALSGYWTNRSVQRQFDSQRSAAIEDQRREVFAQYLSATTELCLAWDRDPEGRSERAQKAQTEFLNEDARVRLLTKTDEVRQVVEELLRDVEEGKACADEEFLRLRRRFVASAQSELSG